MGAFLKRLAGAVVLGWMLGFVWFAMVPPQPQDGGKTDAAIVLTGGEGRIARGLHALRKGWTRRLLVAGVDREVRPREFAAQYRVSSRTMRCCVTLGFDSVDTRSNGQEAARWIAVKKVKSVRLITTDWHMRRAAFELSRSIPADVTVTRDAVVSHPSMGTLFIEYNKLVARWISQAWGS
jgi:uncharacterized SAM-binding protein YcdF (DUF218 family)